MNELGQYALYEGMWDEYKERINGERFLAGMFPARFTRQDKQDFISNLIAIATAQESANETTLKD